MIVFMLGKDCPIALINVEQNRISSRWNNSSEICHGRKNDHLSTIIVIALSMGATKIFRRGVPAKNLLKT
jgi:hypothetical protein